MLVVLDACVLYPPSLRDLLVTLAASDAFDVRWSETILERSFHGGIGLIVLPTLLLIALFSVAGEWALRRPWSR